MPFQIKSNFSPQSHETFSLIPPLIHACECVSTDQSDFLSDIIRTAIWGVLTEVTLDLCAICNHLIQMCSIKNEIMTLCSCPQQICVPRLTSEEDSGRLLSLEESRCPGVKTQPEADSEHSGTRQLEGGGVGGLGGGQRG